MKIALYIEDGLEQIVLTPETQVEQRLLSLLHDGQRDISIARGSFYACRGGWTRQRRLASSMFDPPDHRSDDESTMLVMRPKTPVTASDTEGVSGSRDEVIPELGA